MRNTKERTILMDGVVNEASDRSAGDRWEGPERHHERERRAVALGADNVEQQRREDAVLEAVPEAVQRAENEERLDAQEEDEGERRECSQGAFAHDADRCKHRAPQQTREHVGERRHEQLADSLKHSVRDCNATCGSPLLRQPLHRLHHRIRVGNSSREQEHQTRQREQKEVPLEAKRTIEVKL